MSDGICANTGTGTGEKGCQKYPGGQVHMFWWTSEQIISIASLKDKPFMDALIYASANRMAVLKNAEFFEPVAPEQDISTPDYGSDEVLSQGSAKLIVKHKSGNVMRRTLEALNGETIYVMIGTEKNVLTGIRSSYDNLKTAKATVNVIDEMIDTKREYKDVEITFDPEVVWNDVKKDIQLAYRINDLTNLTGLYLHLDSVSAAGDAEATITDADDTLKDGLAITDITLWNVTDKALVVIGTVVDNADGTYTIPITSGAAAGDTVEVRFAGPASDNLYIQIETQQFEAAA